MSLQQTIESIIQSPLTLSKLTTLDEAITAMKKARVSCVMVVEENKLIGIFTERDVVRLLSSEHDDFNKIILDDVMTKKVITIQSSEDKNLFELSRLFSANKIRHLPVVDDNQKLLGVITPQTLRSLIKPEHLLRYIRVNEVMVKKVIQGSPHDSLLKLIQQLIDHRVSCIVIVDPESAQPIGIVTERDIVQCQSLGIDFAKVSTQEVMSYPLSTVKPQDSLWAVNQLMENLRVRRLVVTDSNNQLAGIVTQTQMLQMLDPLEMYHVLEQMQLVIEQQTRNIYQLNEKLQQANLELNKLATIDELTQIKNRRYFNDYFLQAWQRLLLEQEPLSLILCDVDNFKAFNDTYGHVAGDKCLIKIAQLLQQTTRSNSDLVARYGGEEFVIILPNTDSDGVERIANSILSKITEIKIPHSASSNNDYVTVSMGCVTTIPNSSSSPHIFLDTADKLLYKSKQQGRNTYNLQII